MSRQRRRHRLLRIATLAGLVATVTAGLLTGTAAAVSQSNSAAEEITAITEKRTAVVVLNYIDAKYDLTPGRRAQLEGWFFGTDWNSSAKYYEEASDGRVTFVPLPGQPKILGAYEVNAQRSCSFDTVQNQAIAALAAHNIPRTAYDSLAILHNVKPECRTPERGWGFGNGDEPGWVTWYAGPGPMIVKHEFGHNFGLAHLYASMTCSGTLANCTAGGARGTSPMAAENTGLAAPELRALGWHNPAAGQHQLDPAPGTYKLTPLHAPRDVSGTRILEISRPNNPNNRLFVSFRGVGTIDTTGTTAAGVQLHLSRPGNRNSYQHFTVVDPHPETGPNLAVGKSLTDPVSGVTITTMSKDASGAVVKITRTTP